MLYEVITRTRELNYFDIGEGQLYLVDLPGFGYAKRNNFV